MQQAESRADQNHEDPWTSLPPVQAGGDMQEQWLKGELPLLLVSAQQFSLLKLQRNLCITPRQGQAQQSSQPTQYAKVTGPGTHTQQLPTEMGFPPHLRSFQLTFSTAAMPGNPPSQLPHHSQILTCDSLQTSPYHLPQDSFRFTSHLKAPTRTISGVILPFVSQQRAALRKSWCAWASVRARHARPTLL